jgi:hypothetical protein
MLAILHELSAEWVADAFLPEARAVHETLPDVATLRASG